MTITFDLTTVPFSRYGSYFAISRLPPRGDHPAGLYLRTVRGAVENSALFRIEVLAGGQPVPFEEEATPAALRLQAEAGMVEVVFDDPAEGDMVRWRGKDVGLRLTMPGGLYTTAIQATAARWQINSLAHLGQFMLSAIEGAIQIEAPWDGVSSDYVQVDFLPDEAGSFAAAVEEFSTHWAGDQRDLTPIDQLQASVAAEFDAWQLRLPAVPDAYRAGRDIAAYINWSCVVAPSGYLQRPAMFMSKNWMSNIWSWDHCFNAWALAYHMPDAAWDQFMVMFDQQVASGAIPDLMNDRIRVWNFCKPPIHGWTLRRMMERNTAFADAAWLAEAYDSLVRWTEWWFTSRDEDGDGLPQYNHGNDSGWDNSTVFAAGMPVESPDLLAHLIIQMDVLAEVAGQLGKADEAAQWTQRADALLDRLLSELWRGDHFVARHALTHQDIACDSLLLYIPLVLGKRLPPAVFDALVAGLTGEGRFLTEHGLATESVRSPHYRADGYWRGPIWAPSTLLIVDGLADGGQVALAQDIARRFCRMATRSGMAENYDALTGEGLRDRAYTWTSSVFLILAHEYLQDS